MLNHDSLGDNAGYPVFIVKWQDGIIQGMGLVGNVYWCNLPEDLDSRWTPASTPPDTNEMVLLDCGGGPSDIGTYDGSCWWEEGGTELMYSNRLKRWMKFDSLDTRPVKRSNN